MNTQPPPTFSLSPNSALTEKSLATDFLNAKTMSVSDGGNKTVSMEPLLCRMTENLRQEKGKEQEERGRHSKKCMGMRNNTEILKCYHS